jgi:phosphate transport system substrate-binding protein
VDAIIQGAGSAFPAPLYMRWFREYHLLHPEAEFKYELVGSGGGIREVLAGSVDFGASDVPISDEQLSQAEIPILHIPTVLGAVVPIYNVFGVGQLRFTPEILAGIYLGKITLWDDPTIAGANPRMQLPNQPIVVVHRSDGNSSTFIFTDYLSKISSEWNDSVGKGTSVAWPVGLGGKGNEGVANTVEHLDGAIGYVDLLYAQQVGISYGSVQNAAGGFIHANLTNVTEAAATVRELPADFRLSITNAPGVNAYPISSFTWLLVPRVIEDATTRRDLSEFLKWMIRDGQDMTAKLGYAPLPKNIASKIDRTISMLH